MDQHTSQQLDKKEEIDLTSPVLSFDKLSKLSKEQKIKYFKNITNLSEHEIINPVKLAYTEEIYNSKIYIGNLTSYFDIDNLTENKIDIIINCVSSCGYNPNDIIWEKKEIMLFNINKLLLPDKQLSVLLDIRNDIEQDLFSIFDYIVPFLNKCVKLGTNILILCYNGYSIAPCILTAYLIYNYHKTIQEILVYIKTKLTCLHVNNHFMDELYKYYSSCNTKLPAILSAIYTKRTPAIRPAIYTKRTPSIPKTKDDGSTSLLSIYFSGSSKHLVLSAST